LIKDLLDWLWPQECIVKNPQAFEEFFPEKPEVPEAEAAPEAQVKEDV
jgi:hypothetical protein